MRLRDDQLAATMTWGPAADDHRHGRPLETRNGRHDVPPVGTPPIRAYQETPPWWTGPENERIGPVLGSWGTLDDRHPAFVKDGPGESIVEAPTRAESTRAYIDADNALRRQQGLFPLDGRPFDAVYVPTADELEPVVEAARKRLQGGERRPWWRSFGRRQADGLDASFTPSGYSWLDLPTLVAICDVAVDHATERRGSDRALFVHPVRTLARNRNYVFPLDTARQVPGLDLGRCVGWVAPYVAARWRGAKSDPINVASVAHEITGDLAGWMVNAEGKTWYFGWEPPAEETNNGPILLTPEVIRRIVRLFDREFYADPSLTKDRGSAGQIRVMVAFSRATGEYVAIDWLPEGVDKASVIWVRNDTDPDVLEARLRQEMAVQA